MHHAIVVAFEYHYEFLIDMLEIVSNEVDYFLFSCVLLPICSPEDVRTAETEKT